MDLWDALNNMTEYGAGVTPAVYGTPFADHNIQYDMLSSPTVEEGPAFDLNTPTFDLDTPTFDLDTPTHDIDTPNFGSWAMPGFEPPTVLVTTGGPNVLQPARLTLNAAPVSAAAANIIEQVAEVVLPRPSDEIASLRASLHELVNKHADCNISMATFRKEVLRAWGNRHPVTPRNNEFQVFIKDNYGGVRAAHPTLSHACHMKMLGRMWNDVKPRLSGSKRAAPK